MTEPETSRKPTRRKWLRRGLWGLLGVALLGAAVGAGRAEYEAVHVPHFSCVVPGVLFRSGQPGPWGLRRLLREHGLRTVVMPRNSESIRRDARAQAELAIAREQGVRVVHLPVEGENGLE